MKQMLWTLQNVLYLGNEEISVHVHGGKHKAQKQNNEAYSQVAHPTERRPPGLHWGRLLLL